jgi:two-component system NarL family sensor kinase
MIFSRISFKLVLIVGISLLGMIALAPIALSTLRGQMVADRQAKILQMVDVVYGILTHQQKLESEGKLTREQAQAAAIAEIKSLRYDKVEYFWLNDMAAKMIMHPIKPELDGKDLSDMKDPTGNRLFSGFVDVVKTQGAGFYSYLWPKPGFDQPVAKISYVKGFTPWGWIVGTGIYLDDVDTTLAHIDAGAAANIDRTMKWIDAIAMAGLAVIALCAVVLNFTEYRSADAKLKRLAQQVVESQENERARLSRELHDGISQMMVSVKLLLESALARFERSEARVPAAEAALATSLVRLGDTLREVRRISHALRPSMLDDLGVAAALEQLTRELSEESGIEIGFTQIAHTHAATLPDAVNTVLFRIAQEALTNIVRHAQASSAALALEISHDTVTLTIADNGRGFDVTHAFVGRRSGVGLRNMRERLEALGGTLSLASQAGHTVVSARVPLQTSDAPLSPLLDIRP